LSTEVYRAITLFTCLINCLNKQTLILPTSALALNILFLALFIYYLIVLFTYLLSFICMFLLLKIECTKFLYFFCLYKIYRLWVNILAFKYVTYISYKKTFYQHFHVWLKKKIMLQNCFRFKEERVIVNLLQHVHEWLTSLK